MKLKQWTAEREVLDAAEVLADFFANVVTIAGDAEIQDAQRERWNGRRDRIEDRLCEAVGKLREARKAR